MCSTVMLQALQEVVVQDQETPHNAAKFTSLWANYWTKINRLLAVESSSKAIKSSSLGKKTLSTFCNLQSEPHLHNSHDFLFLCRRLQLLEVPLSCICWDAQHHAGLCPLPDSRKYVLMTQMFCRYDETQKLKTTEVLSTRSLELILAPEDNRYSTTEVWPVLVATCRGVLYNCGVDTSINCNWVTCQQIPIRTEFISEQTQAQVTSRFTSSLMFRSAPWLFRALTTPRLPPLHAQWIALEPSWKTLEEL